MFYPFELRVHAVYVLLGTLTPGGRGVGRDSAYESGGSSRLGMQISDFGLT